LQVLSGAGRIRSWFGDECNSTSNLVCSLHPPKTREKSSVATGRASYRGISADLPIHPSVEGPEETPRTTAVSQLHICTNKCGEQARPLAPSRSVGSRNFPRETRCCRDGRDRESTPRPFESHGGASAPLSEEGTAGASALRCDGRSGGRFGPEPRPSTRSSLDFTAATIDVR